MSHCIANRNTVHPLRSTAGIVQDPSPCAAPLAGRRLPISGAARTIPADRLAIQHKNYIGKKTNTELRQKIPLELRAKAIRASETRAVNVLKAHVVPGNHTHLPPPPLFTPLPPLGGPR